MAVAFTSTAPLNVRLGRDSRRRARTMRVLLTLLFVVGLACGLRAQKTEAPPDVSGNRPSANTDDRHAGGKLLAGTAVEPSEAVERRAATTGAAEEAESQPPDMRAEPSNTTFANSFAEWFKPLRVSLKHEGSYKVASPRELVNNRSSVQVEYAKLLVENVYLRLDTKLNFHWSNDHLAKAKDRNLFVEMLPRETYLQSSFGKTSVRVGYQILPWGVSEAGAITDEISPRNVSEFFFVSLEESRIGQPMVTVDQFSRVGQWTGFFVPRPSYNKYPDRKSEYDIPGVFDVAEPKRRWDAPSDFEYGLRWQRTFGKSDFGLMAASLIDNDYIVRKQRFSMYGLTANIAKENLLFRAEAALKMPKALFAQAADGLGTTIVERNQFDASLGFDYSPGGRSLVYSAEVVLNHVLDWQNVIISRARNEYSFVGRVSNRFLHDDLSVTWLTIYNQTYGSSQHKLLTSYKLNDNSSFDFEAFYPYERDPRSASWPYRGEKQVVTKYRFQF